MQNRFFAVIDTNVLVSALISRSVDSNPVKIIRAITQEKIIPMFNDEILAEYEEVLSRDKFGLDTTLIANLISTIRLDGLHLERTKVLDEYFPDEKDIVFYEIAISKEGSYLITGNLKHFPVKPFVVSPAEMVTMLEEQGEPV